ncbi:MAG: urea carboxylase [Halioglobus sp.]|nr:urea carboxylase [Halioglobus sp.]
MFRKVLIANRGAIATRINRTLSSLGIESVAIYNEVDRLSLHVRQADCAVSLGTGTAADTYLDIEKVLQAAKNSGADAIHPGYGFLSENTDFVVRCEKQGIVFVGPTAQQIELFGLKHLARQAAERAGVPLVPGSPLLLSLTEAIAWAEELGYPVMLKSTAGGGGIGMQVCDRVDTLHSAWESVRRQGANYFANDGVYLEKYIANARHIEVQVFGDGEGGAISLGERDCSAQRRNQKVIEETPAPNLADESRQNLQETAERLMASVRYRNAGTVEFIYDTNNSHFYFLEVNTRLQVEHGISEEVWGIDLVEWMLKQAAGELINLRELKQGLSPHGHAIQVRVYAEDPSKDFQPCAGMLSQVRWPEAPGLRIDHWIESGIEVPALFDPMLAKIIVHDDDRHAALQSLSQALDGTEIYGIETNLPYAQCVIADPVFQRGHLLTRSLAELYFSANTAEVLSPGTFTTLQDYPGRIGYWHVGVPPSGPMDSLSFRLGNRLVHNSPDAAALEITLNGPTLKFNRDSCAVLTGADIEAALDGEFVAGYQVFDISAGQVLRLGKIMHHGARAYLSIAGGFQCPAYLGSKSTFTLGRFGGHVGRCLRTTDVLHLTSNALENVKACTTQAISARPNITAQWTLRVIYGPHGAPDFFTEDDIANFFDSDWEVHYNSSRTGIRLNGPKPCWARETGGDAGLHPSNIHDNAYAFGAVDFTGDMPVILGPDGPSLGGFVCPATVITADLWKLGQLKAGDLLRFVAVSQEHAVQLEAEQLRSIETLSSDPVDSSGIEQPSTPVVMRKRMGDDDLVFRQAGDHFLLVELGPEELDIERRFRIHALMLRLEENGLAGIRELTPGIRSLQIHYDAQLLPLADLMDHVARAADATTHRDVNAVPSRIVHLPLSWNDEACSVAIEKYAQSVRPGAPWCPSNLEFIRRINGLENIEAVRRIVFDANYLVLGLGDVYLGAPLATPLDPRHRLVTTKYNPARTWTAENSVGIGGAYLCVYGMEGPGGYQFIGRTLQMWNRYHQTEAFNKPWLLRFFDQIRFYPVSQDELRQIRRDFPLGDYPLRIDEATFNLQGYRQHLEGHRDQISAFESRRKNAFAAELARWKRDGQLTYQPEELCTPYSTEESMPEGVSAIDSPVSGNVWKLLVEAGDDIDAGDTVMILESMKMEIDIRANQPGCVQKSLVRQGQAVHAGQALLWLDNGNS